MIQTPVFVTTPIITPTLETAAATADTSTTLSPLSVETVPSPSATVSETSNLILGLTEGNFYGVMAAVGVFLLLAMGLTVFCCMRKRSEGAKNSEKDAEGAALMPKAPSKHLN